MNKITIAFDVDGTLRDNTINNKVVANENIRTLLITLSRMKNTHIIVWSGGGELYARQVVNALALEKYVNAYADKTKPEFKETTSGSFKVMPDIAIDDIQDCELGKINLIVREK